MEQTIILIIFLCLTSQQVMGSCRGYYDVSGTYHGKLSCEHPLQFCCGSCDSRQCCSIEADALNQDFCNNHNSPNNIWDIHQNSKLGVIMAFTALAIVAAFIVKIVCIFSVRQGIRQINTPYLNQLVLKQNTADFVHQEQPGIQIQHDHETLRLTSNLKPTQSYPMTFNNNCFISS